MEIRQLTKTYHSTDSLVHSCQYHIIWCTKFRRPVLDTPHQDRLKARIVEKQVEYGYERFEMEVMADPVHLLLGISPQLTVSTVVGRIKGYTAHSLRKEFPALKSRLPSLWTRSKFISRVGSVTLREAEQYIENQRGR